MASIATLKGNRMNANQTKTADLSYVRFGNSKTLNAIAATPAQVGLYEMGEDLGAQQAESSIAWADALKVCKSHGDRMMLRSGFVSTYAPLRNVSEASAIKQFNRLASVNAPQTSRKAKSNKETRGRKEKAKAVVAKLSEKDVAARLVACLAYVAKAQSKHAGDSEMLELLGDIAAILGGKHSK